MAALFRLLADNIGTVIVFLIVLALLVLVTVRMIKNKKKGVPTCGCGCSTCPYSGRCHEERPSDSDK